MQTRAQAPACEVGRMSRAFRADSKQCPSVEAASAVHETHGERDTQRLFKRFNLVLKVPFSTIRMAATEGSIPVDVPFLQISDYFSTLVRKHPRVLFGGFDRGGDSEALCDMFWKRYEPFHSQHRVYHDCSLAERRRILPICIHGDKGRGHGKNPVFVFSWESPFGLPEKIRLAGSKSDKAKQRRSQSKQAHGGRLGFTCRQRACDCMTFPSNSLPDEKSCSLKSRKLDNKAFFEALQHNGRGNTVLTRFLICAIPGKVLKSCPGMVEELLGRVAADLQALFAEGISLEGKTFKAVLVGVKGDYEFLAEAGRFQRHYGNVGHVNSLEMCPECNAGGPHVAFEDFSDVPLWTQSLYTDPPWSAGAEPALLHCPFSVQNTASMFRRDMFHTLKYGFCRDLAASVLVFLAVLTYFDCTPEDSRSIDSRLERAFAMFAMWLAAESRSSTLKKFSRGNLHRNTARNFPWLGGKGADTVTCLMFLDFMVATFLRENKNPAHTPLLQAMRETMRGGLDFLGVMHSHDLFLPRACASFMHRAGLTLLRGYSYLAQASMDHHLKLFCLRPKCHYFMHTLYEMSQQLAAGHEWVVSPSIFNCEANEDFIGRISRLSRKVSPKICSQRVLDRYLLGVKLALKRAGI